MFPFSKINMMQNKLLIYDSPITTQRLLCFFCKFKKSIATMNESIKKEVEFKGVFKKDSYKISMGLGF